MIRSTTRKPQGLARLLALPIALKLAVILALVLLISGIITDTVVNRVIREGQQEVVLDDLQTLGRSNAFRMVDVLGQEVTALNSLSTSQVIQAQLTQLLATPEETEAIAPDEILTQEIRTFRQTHSELDSVALLDPEGHVRAIDPVPPDAVDRDPKTSVWFTGAYGNGGGATFLSSPDDDHLTGKTGIHIAIPIYSNENQNEIIGVLYAVWNMSNILDITEVGAGREGLILEPDGTVLISPSDERGTSYPRALTTEFSAPSGSFT